MDDLNISKERKSEIDAMVRTWEKEAETLGLDGLLKNSMSLEELKKHLDEKFAEPEKEERERAEQNK